MKTHFISFSFTLFILYAGEHVSVILSLLSQRLNIYSVAKEIRENGSVKHTKISQQAHLQGWHLLCQLLPLPFWRPSLKIWQISLMYLLRLMLLATTQKDQSDAYYFSCWRPPCPLRQLYQNSSFQRSLVHVYEFSHSVFRCLSP